jgi:hypothetical protein
MSIRLAARSASRLEPDCGVSCCLWSSSLCSARPAVVAGVFNLLAFAVVGAVDRLTDTTLLLGFLRAWLMVLGLIVSCVTGTIAALNTDRGADHAAALRG